MGPRRPGAPRTADDLPGRDEVVEILFRRHYPDLLRLAYCVVGDRAQAEDAVQDAFVSMYARWGPLRDPAAAPSSLQSAVLTRCRSTVARGQNPRLAGAVQRLPRRQREVVVCRHYLGLTVAETAELLGIATGSVPRRARRGIAALTASRSRTDLAGIERRVSEDQREFADITIDERDISQAQQHLRARVAVMTRRRSRTRLGLATGAVAIVAAAAGAWWLPGTGSRTATLPDWPTVPDRSPLAIATRFVEAYAAFDVGRVGSMLAPGVGVDGLADRPDNWAGANRFLEATGTALFLDLCTQVTAADAGTTMRCPFDYQALHSADIGRGPFGGSSFLLTIDDGKIVGAAIHWDVRTNTFSRDMWEPFAAWVSTTNPRDTAAMYADWPSTQRASFSNASISLWRQHTQEYVEHVRQTGTGTPR